MSTLKRTEMTYRAWAAARRAPMATYRAENAKLRAAARAEARAARQALKRPRNG